MQARHVNRRPESAEIRHQNTTLGCLRAFCLSESVSLESGCFRVWATMTRQRKSNVGEAKGDPQRVAYLHDMLHSMNGLAKGAGHDFLAYLIAVAQQEAARLAGRGKS